jgi:hypothetical protein
MMDINDIINSENIENLGSIEELAIIINEFMQPFSIKAVTYSELTKAINFVKENINFSEKIFCSREKEYLFYLIHLEGEQRNKFLGIKDVHYEDKEKAKNWYREIVKYIHPDKNKDPDANKAFVTLNKIYNQMIDEDYNE